MFPTSWSRIAVFLPGLTAALLSVPTPARAAPPASGWIDGPGFRSRDLLPTGTNARPGFSTMTPAATGVAFTNELTGDLYLTNAVAHNGAGVAVGDVDGDDRPDIYFCNLQGPNRLYRNLGNWRFEEMTLAEAACAGQLSTGAALADIDGDRDLDLLVNGIAAGTRLFLNDGKGRWTEARDSGLSRKASATSLALADIDGDGDLDLYCTHFIDAMHLADPTTRFALAKRGDKWEVSKVNGESARSPKWQGRFEALPDGKVRELPEVHGLYRNEGNGRFKAIEFEPGIYLNEQGAPIPPYRDWGLAVMFRDINRDGFPDLYVCNDNTSPDRIWINTGQGTFRAVDPLVFRHTSRSSMGVDFGDINRDGHDDIIVVDMLARDHARRVTQLVRDRPNPLDAERIEERPQYNRNTLFYGRADGHFVEAALLAGVAATDWTWTTVFLDVDLDGFEDLLVTNGFEFDVMDQDSHNFIKDGRRRLTEAQLKRSMQFHPRWKTANAAFRNRGDGTFEPCGDRWGFDRAGVSFGMAQGDLDNDGDLDLVVNNLNEVATLYRNDAGGGRIAVRLRGRAPNTEAVGARLQLIAHTLTQAQEMICAGRYLSGDQAMRVFAAGPRAVQPPARLEVRWRNGGVSIVADLQPNRLYEIIEPATTRDAPSEKPGAPAAATALPQPLFADVSSWLNHVHVEAPFDDWERQPLLPRRLSRLGPGMAWADLDADGWEDLAVTAGRGGRLAVFRNEQGRAFRAIDSSPPTVEDQGAVLAWPDGRGQRRLVVATANNEVSSPAISQLTLHSFTNLAAPDQFPIGPASPGPLASADIDGDGDLDLFVGGRLQPGRYPEPVSSMIWLAASGKLSPNVEWSAPFREIGLVSGAAFVDLDDDADADLVLAIEWGPIRVFKNAGGKFEDATAEWGLAGLNGWWTGVIVGDFNGDSRMDLACGNWGRNTAYELYPPGNFRLYHGEWLNNGVVQMIEAWQSGTRWLPIRDRTWLSRGLPELPAQIPTHEAFGRASIQDVLGPTFAKASFLQATQLSSMVFLNRGTRFEAAPLPREAQLAPVFGLAVGDADADGIEDLFIAQNFFGAGSDISREDAGRGLWLRGRGDGTFSPLDSAVSGVHIMGEQRGAALADFNHDGRVDLAVAQNNAATKLYLNRGSRTGLRVVLAGPAGNPDAVGARIQIVYASARRGPSRLISAGAGYWSQDAAAPVLGLAETSAALAIRWPDGREETVPLANENPNSRETATTVRVEWKK